jgi:hypothetical protein
MGHASGGADCQLGIAAEVRGQEQENTAGNRALSLRKCLFDGGSHQIGGWPFAAGEASGYAAGVFSG